MQKPGRKIYTTTVETLLLFHFSGLRPLWCLPFFPDLWCIQYTLFPCFPRKMAYTIAVVFLLCDLRVGRQTEKRGVPQWWCIIFFPLTCGRLQQRAHSLRARPLKRVTLIRVGLFTTEATIKIEHKLGARSSFEWKSTHVLGTTIADGKTSEMPSVQFHQKSLGVHKILVRKIWFCAPPPPQEKGPK